MGWFDRKPTYEERLAQQRKEDELAARDRWIAHNAAAKAAGCKCGAPATHVRRYGGTVGGVPAETWTCEAHRNVNQWSKASNDAHWRPTGDVTPEVEAWRVP